ncbi:glycosyltransferase family 4 protein [Ovoidimarina sediminis]|uniref:glycosyltransferase family 4 protein n=1 Tax=Ovoidimarina sediminis TaxID=3079856 RepID=UPI0029082B96|nr:glycosyltransferase family 4 protein [Rhodophyticola sp. MJ-SS7]MDU8944843.1 glycosyltransferase family 4 protein [Rhodophyticola sp. MJ-SS7]
MTPEVYITNFNPNFTGVSATAAAVSRVQARKLAVQMVGYPLPDCPDPVSRAEAIRLCRTVPEGRPFSIWHVRRNPEMRAAIWARDVLRRPIRIVFTSAAQRRHSAVPRWLINRMDAVIATSEAAASFVPHVRSVVPHGVDTERFHPSSEKAAAWGETGFPGMRGVATIGRVRPEKGTDVFVEAMLRVLPDLPDLTALVIGKIAREHKGFAEALKARIAAAGLSERILFVGEIAPEETPMLIRSITLVVNLPRYEGYGVVPLEAMASGTPFVASEAGHYREFSAQGTAGLVVPVGDADAAAAAIRTMLTDPDRYRAAQAAGRSQVETMYSVEREARAITDVYLALWSEAGVPRT